MNERFNKLTKVGEVVGLHRSDRWGTRALVVAGQNGTNVTLWQDGREIESPITRLNRSFSELLRPFDILSQRNIQSLGVVESGSDTNASG
jgi:hypothetical protein